MGSMVVSQLPKILFCVSQNMKFLVHVFLKTSFSRIYSSFLFYTFSLQLKYQNSCRFCVILVDRVYKRCLGLQEEKKSPIVVPP